MTKNFKQKKVKILQNNHNEKLEKERKKQRKITKHKNS
jgi:hypothetical protein